MDADIRRLARLASQGDLNAARALVRALERAQQEADEAGEWPMIPRSVLITARRSAMMSRLPQTIGRVPLEEASGHFRYDLTCPHEIIDGIIWMNFAAAIWDWPGRDPGRFGALALTVLPTGYYAGARGECSCGAHYAGGLHAPNCEAAAS